MDLAAPTRARPFFAFARAHGRQAVLAAAVTIGLAMRLAYDRAAPLWLDETFTGVIAGQPSAAGLFHWLTTELTGPFFYAPMWLWAKLAGTGDTALRAPSLVWTLLAPLFVFVRGHRDPTMRWSWTVLLLLWLPAAPLASDARPYALLMLLATLQVAALCAVLRDPTRKAAVIWAAVTTAMGLTHYPALVTGLVQGAAILAVHRRAAWRLWPAAAPFAVLVAWMAVHLRFVVQIAGKGAAQCPPFGWNDLVRLPTLVVGGGSLAALLGLVIVVDLIGLRRRHTGWSAETSTTVAGMAGFLLLVLIAWAHPGFAPRYFLATVPALLFGASWWLAGAVRRDAPASAAFLGILLLGAASLTAASATDATLDQRHAFELERPSAWLMERPVNRLLFMWADSSAELGPRSLDHNLEEVGAFFFTRAHRHPIVEVVHAPAGTDAAAEVIARVGTDPGTVVLWLANVPSADPRRRPDALIRAPGWACRDWGEGLAVSVACRRIRKAA